MVSNNFLNHYCKYELPEIPYLLDTVRWEKLLFTLRFRYHDQSYVPGTLLMHQ